MPRETPPPPLPPELQGLNARETQMSALRDTAREIAARQIESLRLYTPLPFQEKYHSSTAKEVVLRKGNQIGGTLSGAAEVARAVTGQDPHGKYPKNDGVVIVLGYGESHIGKVFYPALFMADQFKIIYDEQERRWRTFRPWSDEALRAKAKPAPPLIPKRFVKKIAWVNKSKRIFARVDLTTGWTIYAFNSSGMPEHAQGIKASLVWIDEDTDNPGWYDEMLARLSLAQQVYNCKGFLRWTAMPHSKNEDMLRLIERADDEQGSDNPQSVVIAATVFDNPYYPKEALENNIRIWKSQGDDVYRKRALGELTNESQLMYPGFSKFLHDAHKQEEPRTKMQEAYAKVRDNLPPDWTLYASVDPGHTICAITYYAVPPPSLGDYAICYAEDYLHGCDAVMFANALERRTKDRQFEAFIIDAHGGRLRELGSGMLPREQYTAEMRKRGITSLRTKSGFIDGCDDIEGREHMLRQWLLVRTDGTTRLLIDVERCPNLVKEISRFSKKVVRVNGVDVITDTANRKNSHAVETLEYAVAFGLPYVKPPTNRTSGSWIDSVLATRRWFDNKSRARGLTKGQQHITLGPKG